MGYADSGMSVIKNNRSLNTRNSFFTSKVLRKPSQAAGGNDKVKLSKIAVSRVTASNTRYTISLLVLLVSGIALCSYFAWWMVS